MFLWEVQMDLYWELLISITMFMSKSHWIQNLFSLGGVLLKISWLFVLRKVCRFLIGGLQGFLRFMLWSHKNIFLQEYRFKMHMVLCFRRVLKLNFLISGNLIKKFMVYLISVKKHHQQSYNLSQITLQSQIYLKMTENTQFFWQTIPIQTDLLWSQR